MVKKFLRSFFILLVLSTTLFANEKKNILVFLGYNASTPATQNFIKGLEKINEENQNLFDFYFEYIDEVSIHSSLTQDELIKYFLKKYSNISFDGILVDSSIGSLLLQSYKDIFFPNIPQVHFNDSHNGVLQKSTDNIKFVGTGLSVAAQKTLELIFKQNFYTKKLYIIHDDIFDSLYVKEFFLEALKRYPTIKTEYLTHEYSLEELSQKVSHLDKNSVILFILLFKDKEGKRLVPEMAIEALSETANRPMYGIFKPMLGFGVVGGYMLDSSLVSYNMVKELMYYFKHHQFPKKSEETIKPFVDYKMLEKYGLLNSYLPKNITIKNRPIPIWESHYRETLLVSTIIVVFVLLIILLIVLNRRLQSANAKQLSNQKLLVQQSRMAAMGEMINNIAHQWRQPLNEINSIVMAMDAEFLKSKLQNRTIESRFVDIETQTHYMSSTIEDFRNFFKPNKNKEWFYLSQALDDTMQISHKMLDNEGIEIEINKLKDREILAYQSEYVQVLLAVLNNAKDALLSTSVSNPKIKITIDDTLTIEDNGGGVDEVVLEKLFEPYFTTKHKSKGTGIGLYMVKTIIEESMNGKVKLENYNGGVRVTIDV